MLETNTAKLSVKSGSDNYHLLLQKEFSQDQDIPSLLICMSSCSLLPGLKSFLFLNILKY